MLNPTSLTASTPSPLNALPRARSAERLMWITPGRVFYAGLLGAPGPRTQGALAVYVALDAPLRIRLHGGAWQQADVAVVPPYVPYEVATEARHVLNLLIEPETVDLTAMPAVLQSCGAVHAPEWAARVRRCHADLVAQARAVDLQPCDFDTLFWGQTLPPRVLDARIARALHLLQDQPSSPVTAQACAAQAHLSFSRFLHLFKQEVGAPFRSVRTWKRARSVLHHVNSAQPLVHVALDIGYPDSTHFSHSIRQTFGLKPRDIFAGSRKLRIIGGPRTTPTPTPSPTPAPGRWLAA